MRIDADQLEQSLRNQSETLLVQWLPGGKVNSYRNEYVCDSIHGGAGDSFGVNLETFEFNDLNGSQSSKGKGMISLYMKQRNVDFKTALEELSGYSASDYVPVSIKEKPANIGRPTYYEKPLDTLNGVPATSMWYYYDEFGDEIHCVVRFDKAYNDKKGKNDKTFRQWTNTDHGWEQKGPKKNKPLYNGHVLNKYPDAQIVVVEGEKCADALNKIFTPEKSLAVSWMGGTGQIHLANWSTLKDRNVIFWPDSDQPGFDTRMPMLKLLTPIVSKLKIIDVPEGDSDAFDMNLSGASEFLAYATKYIKQIKPYPKDIIESNSGSPKPQMDVSKLSEGGALLYQSDEKSISLQSGYPHMRLDAKGNPIGPMATLENFECLLEKVGARVRYNVISKTGDITLPNQSFLIDTERIAKLANILSYMAQANMPQNNYADFLEAIAAKNLYNPVAECIESKPWDGVSRLQDLYDTVTVDPQYESNKQLYMRKWLISAVAAAYSQTGVTVRGILVFQGDQNLGKTYWFTRLVPPELKETLLIGHSLAPQDKDNVQKTVSHWMVELGELDATFKKSDISRLKAFISDYKDSLRPAFIKERATYARRTVFFASVNPEKFLNDPTGSSRFWTIKCKHLNNKHEIDMQQLWAEVKTIYDSGETWHLSNEQIMSLEVNNTTSQANEEFIDLVESCYEFKDDGTFDNILKQTVSEITHSCGLKPDSKNMRLIGEAVRKLTKQKDALRSNGKWVFNMPAKRIQDDSTKEKSPPPWIRYDRE